MSGIKTAGEIQQIFLDPGSPYQGQLYLALENLQREIFHSLFGLLLQFLTLLGAYFGCIDIWVRAYRLQEVRPIWATWISAMRIGVFRGLFVFLAILFLVGPLQLWSLFLGGFLMLSVTILFGGLLLMGPAILAINPRIGCFRVIPYALLAKYARPPVQLHSLVGSTITNLSLLYMVGYGFLGLSYLGEKWFLNMDFLPAFIHDFLYNLPGAPPSLTPAFFIAHLWHIFVKMFVIGFISHGTVHLYFSLGQRRKIVEI